MAIYLFSARVVKRSEGRSVTAAAAYRAAIELEDERTGQSFDYTRRRGVVHSEILAPDNTPEWMCDRAQLWNAVERVEKRRDAQLAREIQLALPHELTPDQRLGLVRDFVREEFVNRGMIADLAVHDPDRKGDQRNHHAHVLLTMRELAGDDFGKKERAWNDTAQLEQWRERWANAVNRELERHGHEARVDHRSNADRGIDHEPEPKMGPIATDMERQGRASHAGDDRRAVKERNAQRDATRRELQTIERALAANENLADARTGREQAEARAAERVERQGQAEYERGLIGAARETEHAIDEAANVAKAGVYVMDKVTGEATKVAEFAARVLSDLFAGPPRREITPAEYAASKEARREHREQQAAARQRDEALDRIRRDMQRGHGLDAENVRRLSRDDLINLKARGDAHLVRMIEDREAYEKRRYEGRDRDR